MAKDDDYTAQAMKEHAGTYGLFLTLLKAGMVLVAIVLLILIFIYNI